MAEVYLQTDSLQVGYDNKALIRDICLSVKQGEIITLAGPNGAGKSTILKSIARQLELIGGKVMLCGKDMAELSAKELSRRMSVVFTERNRPELMTCRDVVSAGRYPYTGLMGMLSDEDRAAVERALCAVDALEIADRSFNAISDGQRQRVLLARALCQEPGIIILDEPTSYLDIRHKTALLTILQRMSREEKITVIMALHEIDLAQKVSDRIICVDGEAVTAFGTPEEVLTEEKVKQLYHMEEGAYDPCFGSLELPKAAGDPEVFVFSSCGTGIPVYRKLRREGTPFAAGILYKNDIDYHAAQYLASEIVTAEPFSPVTEEEIGQAKELIRKCGRVINCGVTIGESNQKLRLLLEEIKENKEINYVCI